MPQQEQPTYSIVIPSFNQGRFIRETIDSILEQDGVTVEALVMDGGSTDETVSILESYGDRVQWVSEKDDGQADAVNKGFRRARGKYVGWLNSDDLYFDGALRAVKEAFEANPNALILYGEADHVAEDGSYMEDYPTEEWSFERLKEHCFICQPSVFFRREAFDRYGVLGAKWQYCMDYEYWLRIGMMDPMLHIPVKLAKSRLYDQNKTLGSRVPVHDEIARMFIETIGELPTRWLYNYCHAELEADGISSDTVGELRFRWHLIRSCASASRRFTGKLPWGELPRWAGWLIASAISRR